MEYFYAPPHAIARTELVIEAEEFSHLTHVMRKEIGDRFVVVDGMGGAYLCRLHAISRRSAVCMIEERMPRLHEPSLHVTAAVALLKQPARMDYIVEKLTEIGVSAFLPLRTARTIPEHVRSGRLENIALSAMKQSGRCVVPTIQPMTRFGALLEDAGAYGWKVIPHESTREPELHALQGPSRGRALLCIGPEGGFTDEEIVLAESAGFLPVSLGERRLRTETASVVAAAWMLR